MQTFSVEAASAARARAFCDAFLAGRRPRFLFGRNKYAVSIAGQVDIDGFVDDFTDESTFRDKPIAKLESLPRDALVLNCVAVGRPLTAQRRIDSLGYDQLDYYAFLRHSGLDLQPIDYWVGFADHFERSRADYEGLDRALADPLSREVLARLINFRLTYDLDHMRIFSDTQARQYFEGFVAFGREEVFADIGAFDGITSQAFAQRCPDYRGIFVFEPNPRSLEVARQRLPVDPRIRFVASAIGAREERLRFDHAGSSSRIAEHGAEEVQVEPLDNYADTPFTFLKMDIEGAEGSALSGAGDVIRRSHPKMAISVYHNPADLIDIPRQVLAIRDDYELRLRHYTEGFTETVMYFLPRP